MVEWEGGEVMGWSDSYLSIKMTQQQTDARQHQTRNLLRQLNEESCVGSGTAVITRKVVRVQTTKFPAVKGENNIMRL